MKFDVRDKLYIKIFGGVNGILANIINIDDEGGAKIYENIKNKKM